MNELTIEYAGEFKKLFLERLAPPSPFSWDVTDIQNFDLAGIQILIALYKECELKGIPFTLSGKVAKEVGERLRRAGFCKEIGCETGAQLAELIARLIKP